MWQILLISAIAGSVFIAIHLLKSNDKPVESSSSDESSSLEEHKVVVADNKDTDIGKKPAKESSSSDSSDEDDDTVVTQSVSGTVKNGLALVLAKKEKSESSESCESEDAKVTKQPSGAAKIDSAKKDESESYEECEPDEEEKNIMVTVQPILGTTVKTNFNAVKEEETSDNSEEDSSDDNDSDEEAKMAPSKQPAATKQPSITEDVKSSKKVSKEVSSESEDTSDESSDEEPSKPQPVRKDTKKASSSSDDEFEEDSSEEEKLPSKTPNRSGTHVEMVDAPSTSKTPQTPVTPQDTGGSKTVFMGNLSYSIEEENVMSFFKDAGKIVEVRFEFAGYGYVEFATAEAAQKALKLNNQMLKGRAVRLNLAKERGAFTPGSRSIEKPFQKGQQVQGTVYVRGFDDSDSLDNALKLNNQMLKGRPVRLDLAKERGAFPPASRSNEKPFRKGQQVQGTVYVRGFDASDSLDNIKANLGQHFGDCGKITRMSIPKDYESGVPRGFAYIDFANLNGFKKALELHQSDFKGCKITVEQAWPKDGANVNRDEDNRGTGPGGPQGRGPGSRPRRVPGSRGPENLSSRGPGNLSGRGPGSRGLGNRFGRGPGSGDGSRRGPSEPSMATVATGKKTVFDRISLHIDGCHQWRSQLITRGVTAPSSTQF